MIKVTTNINSTPTIEVVALSTVAPGKFVQFIWHRTLIGAKLTINEFNSVSSGFTKGLVVAHRDEKTLLFRITSAFGDDYPVEFTDCPVIVYSVAKTDIELALDFE